MDLCYCPCLYLGQCSVLLVSLSCPTACLLAFTLFIIARIKMDGWMLHCRSIHIQNRLMNILWKTSKYVSIKQSMLNYTFTVDNVADMCHCARLFTGLLCSHYSNTAERFASSPSQPLIFSRIVRNTLITDGRHSGSLFLTTNFIKFILLSVLYHPFIPLTAKIKFLLIG